MEDIDYINKVIKHFIPQVGEVKIIKSRLHGDTCPHCLIELVFYSLEEKQKLIPIKDKRYNNIIEKLHFITFSKKKAKFSAQINLQTIRRSADLIDTY
jgi:hypothetical protein